MKLNFQFAESIMHVAVYVAACSNVNRLSTITFANHAAWKAALFTMNQYLKLPINC